VRIEFDDAKNQANRLKHGLDLDEFVGFDREPVVISDERYDYGEPRWQAFGRIAGIGYMIAFTVRDGAARLISFRRVHDKEMSRHE